MKFDDPRLTAYAFGELEDAEDRAAVEALMAAQPEAEAEMEDLMELSAILRHELRAEAAPGLRPDQHAEILASAGIVTLRRGRGVAAAVCVLTSFQRRWTWLPASIAASVMICAGLLAIDKVRKSRHRAPELAAGMTGIAASDDQRQARLGKTAAIPATAVVPVAQATSVLPESVREVPPAGGPDTRSAEDLPKAPALATGNDSTGTSAPFIAGPGRPEEGAVRPDEPLVRKMVRALRPKPAMTDASAEADSESQPRTGAASPASLNGGSLRHLALRVDSQTGEYRWVAPTLQEDRTDACAENPFLAAREHPVSSIALTTGGASYTTVREMLNNDALPPRSAVRIEELLNAFEYHNAQPVSEDPVTVCLEAAACPWAPGHRLLRVDFQSRESASPSVVAKEVTLQIEFNPVRVHAYRLIGYDNPLSAGREFHAGVPGIESVPAGRMITALYELTPAETSPANAALLDPLKYRQDEPSAKRRVLTPPKSAAAAETHKEWLTVRLRWKVPGAGKRVLREFPLTDSAVPLEQSSADFRWASAVAGFGMLLRESPNRGGATWELVRELALQGIRSNADARRREFVELIDKASALSSEPGGALDGIQHERP